jgi:Spy/CpxP family protein refolding chaperone
MKTKFAALTLTAAFAAGSLFAAQAPQDQPAPVHHTADPNRQLKMLAKKLALTGDQQSQLLPILTERDQQMAAVQSDSSLSRKDRHAKLKAIHLDSEAKLHAVLTDTQRQAYDQMEQDRRERAQTRRQTGAQ